MHPPVTSTRHTVERAVAALALALLLGAVGAGGWLVAHVATYDAVVVDTHAHATHGYLEPLGAMSIVGLASGVLATLIALLLTRRVLVDAVLRLHERRSAIPWIAAGGIPAVAFFVVERSEGALGAFGLVVGLGLQSLLGIVAFALVQLLVLALARVVERLSTARTPRLAHRARTIQCRPLGPRRRRRAPLADNAALRGPPLGRGLHCSMA